MTTPKGFSTQIRLTDAEFAALEEKAGIRLGPERRDRVRKVLDAYERLRREAGARPGSPPLKQFAKLGKKFAAPANQIRAMNAKDDGSATRWHLVAMFAGVQPDEALKLLESLSKSCVRVEDYLRSVPHGRRADRELPGVLFELERVFKEAGGGATGVARNDFNERESPFVDFAFEVLSHLPEHLRPRGWGSLAARWERIYSGRKQGKAWLDWAKGPNDLDWVA